MDREDSRGDIVALFQKHNSGDHEVLPALVSAVGDELRRAARRHHASSEPTAPAAASTGALYLEVASVSGIPGDLRRSFLAICARAMRTAVVQYMREDGVRDGLTGTGFIRDLDAALNTLEAINGRLARIIECRYFAALDEEETADALATDVQTVAREWTRARGWALRELAGRPAADAATQPVPNAAWVDAVFDDALALTDGELEPFLERCAAAPGDLRARVEELLRFSAVAVPRFEPGDLSLTFLLSVLRGDVDEPAMPLVRLSADGGGQFDGTAAPVPGSSGWRILGELHTGRLGVLYSADRPDRPSWVKGALRFVPGETSLNAFRRRPDWRVLSALAHAGIARILDSGRTDDGRVFIVSELVEGRPIDQYCDKQRLTIEQRLALFLRVCRAVQYAHRRLAAHGGIKPGTVVVTADGEVKLLDLGVAGLLATGAQESSHEASPAPPGPAFPSPEQRRGEPLGVASDVYQLGLLLHVLLAGAPPFLVETSTPGTIEETLAATPVRPSVAAARARGEGAASRQLRPATLLRVLRGDLDAIVMYAVRREPERRYPSVSLLRSDIQRYLTRRPVLARGDSRSYRIGKFVRRRSLPIAAAVLLAVAGAAAVPVGRAGQATAGGGVHLVDVDELLTDLIASPTGARTGQPNVLYLQQATRIARAELASDPVSQSRVFTKIGRLFAERGFYDRSLSILEEALALRRWHLGDDSLESADTLEALGSSRHHLGRYDEAESDLRTVVAIREVRAGATHSDTLVARVALGEVLHSRGLFIEAERLLRDVVVEVRPEVVEATAHSPVHRLFPRALTVLAGVLRDRGALGEAAVLYDEALAAIDAAEAHVTAKIAAEVGLSGVLLARTEFDRAEAQLERALADVRRTYPDGHPLLAIVLRDYGSLRLEQQQLDGAQQSLAEALRIQEQWLGQIHPLVPRTRAVQAELARRRGDAAEAVTLASSALTGFERAGMADHPWTVEIRATLADALIALDRDADALKVLGPALTSAPRVFVSYDARLVRLHAALARASRHAPDIPVARGTTGSTP